MKPPKFKMTELGPIPEDWEVRHFDDVYSFAAAGDLQKECYSPIQDAAHKYSIFSNGLLKKGLYGYTSQPRYKHDSITITGRGTLGHAEYRDEDFDAIIRLLILTPKEPICNRFVVYWINYFKPFTNESTSIPQLTVPQVASSCLALPPLPEQRRIAGALSDVDELISALGKLIEKKRNIKTGTMQQLLTGKRRLPGFGGKWVEKRLGDCATIKARIGWQGLTVDEYQDTGNFCLIGGSNFEHGAVLWDTCPYVSQERYNQDKFIQVHEGDVLVSKDGTIGKVAFIKSMPKPSTLNSGVFVIRSCDSDLAQLYLARVFLSKWFEGFIDRITAGSTIVHLYQKDIVDFSFSVPPTIIEQKAIAAMLSDMDAEIAALEAEKHKVESIKQGMMQELLTGRVRLFGSEKKGLE